MNERVRGMHKDNKLKLRRVAGVISGVMIPVMAILAATRMYRLLWLAIAIELVLITWLIVLIKNSGNNANMNR